MNINDIIVEDRLRIDLGDLDELANSIREHGLIQPIVVVRTATKNILIAGGRRLAAMKRLGLSDLEHAKHFIYNYEVDPVKQKAIELEENLRRKELSWQEVVRGKQQLLDLMQSIHGVPSGGRPSAGSSGGFGVNKLAAMLGESTATVSNDLQVASFLKSFPTLAKAETKGAALTQVKILASVASMTVGAKTAPKDKEQSWTLANQDFRELKPGSLFIPPESVDLIWTDLPYGAVVDKMSGHVAGSQIASFDDSLTTARSLLYDIAKESWRVLKPDRYAVFCFGFILYDDLVNELKMVGFNVNPVPVVWIKNTKSGENPTTKYSNSYEPILVASKGSPVFHRPGQSNVIQLPVENNKLQAVQKPVPLVERFLLDMCSRGATVVDWCAGTGTTGVAAHKLGMRSILFERDASMYNLAKLRLESL